MRGFYALAGTSSGWRGWVSEDRAASGNGVDCGIVQGSKVALCAIGYECLTRFFSLLPDVFLLNIAPFRIAQRVEGELRIDLNYY